MESSVTFLYRTTRNRTGSMEDRKLKKEADDITFDSVKCEPPVDEIKSEICKNMDDVDRMLDNKLLGSTKDIEIKQEAEDITFDSVKCEPPVYEVKSEICTNVEDEDKMLDNRLSDEKLIQMNEDLTEPVEDKDSDDEYEPEVKKEKYVDYVPLDYKIKVLNIAQQHPKWSLKTLQRRGCSLLKKKEYLTKWAEDVRKGGNAFDKYSMIDSWTYDRYVEAQQMCRQVTTKNLQQWALAAATLYGDLQFKASKCWLVKFKHKHGIP